MQGESADASDLELLHRAGGGQSKAFDELVTRHAPKLYALAKSLVGNGADADDVLQETFVGALGSLRKFEGRSSVKTWLTRILITQAARHHRDRHGRRPEVLQRDESRLGVASDTERVEKRLDVQQALTKLSEDHREVLMLRDFMQMSYEEIAMALNVPRGTVESRLSRARESLREKLKDYQP